MLRRTRRELRAILILSLFAWVISAGYSDGTVGDGQGYGGRLPHLRITRPSVMGGNEGIEVRCNKKGCAVEQTSDGQVVAAKTIPMDKAKSLVSGFLASLPKGNGATANDAGAPALTWEVAEGKQAREGAISRAIDYDRDGAEMGAVLAIEKTLNGEAGK